MSFEALPPFVLVTGNPGKVAEAQRILGFAPPHEGVDLPELQSLDLIEVLRGKGEEAWRRLGRPLVVEETGLELASMNGFPGPLVKWMLEAVGPVGVARAAHALGDAVATAHCALLYRDAERTVIAEGRAPGRLTVEPRGQEGFGWDPVFVPEGMERTFAQLSHDEKNRVGHRGRAWRALAAALSADRRTA